jgi:hypothetical protein
MENATSAMGRDLSVKARTIASARTAYADKARNMRNRPEKDASLAFDPKRKLRLGQPEPFE